MIITALSLKGLKLYELFVFQSSVFGLQSSVFDLRFVDTPYRAVFYWSSFSGAQYIFLFGSTSYWSNNGTLQRLVGPAFVYFFLWNLNEKYPWLSVVLCVKGGKLVMTGHGSWGRGKREEGCCQLQLNVIIL